MDSRICSERAARKMTQAELAAKVGVTRDTISAWERGGEVPGSALKKMTEVFDCSMDWLASLTETRK